MSSPSLGFGLALSLSLGFGFRRLAAAAPADGFFGPDLSPASPRSPCWAMLGNLATPTIYTTISTIHGDIYSTIHGDSPLPVKVACLSSFRSRSCRLWSLTMAVCSWWDDFTVMRVRSLSWENYDGLGWRFHSMIHQLLYHHEHSWTFIIDHHKITILGAAALALALALAFLLALGSGVAWPQRYSVDPVWKISCGQWHHTFQFRFYSKYLQKRLTLREKSLGLSSHQCEFTMFDAIPEPFLVNQTSLRISRYTSRGSGVAPAFPGAENHFNMIAKHKTIQNNHPIAQKLAIVSASASASASAAWVAWLASAAVLASASGPATLGRSHGLW